MQTARSLNRLELTFIALKYPNYRLWFIGQIVSLFGTWMQSTTEGFLVYELTHSPAFLGYVGFAAGMPSWIFMLIGGVMTDRVPRRSLLIVTQSVMMILAFIMAGLNFSGVVRPWHIIVLAFILGITNAFDAPARLALAPELVDRDDLTNAIALNGMMFNTAAIVGPAAAGLVYAAVGPAWCFTINGLSFTAVIASLWLMKLPEFAPKSSNRSAIAELREGIRYTIQSKPIRTVIAIVGVTGMFGFAFVTLLPAWAVEVLGGDAATNGLLNSARGFGALIGALSIAALGRFNYRGKLMTIGTFMFPLILLGFSFIRQVPFALITLCGAGAALMLIMNLANAVVQTYVADEFRGRVMSIFSLVFFGLIPVGSLLLGQIADHTSEPTALVFSCLVLLLFAALIAIFAPIIRHIE
ncbi:MAG: MFS transporter [Anaerolineales bacterium]|nr:MFS transporter [Anaerolineales bacterium]